ncbi:MAG: hypothetical protein WCV84_02025 [Patescibacteria group bacterium]
MPPLTRPQIIALSAGGVLLLGVIGLVVWLRMRPVEELNRLPATPASSTAVTSVSSTTSGDRGTATSSAEGDLPLDTDGDGVSDAREQTLGTNIGLRDTDGDGVSDGDEVDISHTDPLVFDAPVRAPFVETAPVVQPVVTDTDGDGLADAQEATLGTDATKKDTDGDSLSDGEEVNVYGSSPLRGDTDGDGYQDATEIEKGYNPLGPGQCTVPNCAYATRVAL